MLLVARASRQKREVRRQCVDDSALQGHNHLVTAVELPTTQPY